MTLAFLRPGSETGVTAVASALPSSPRILPVLRPVGSSLPVVSPRVLGWDSRLILPRISAPKVLVWPRSFPLTRTPTCFHLRDRFTSRTCWESVRGTE